MRCVYAACIAGALLAATSTAAADEKVASREFAAGQRAFTSGDYRRAAESFEAAYQAKPHHSALWNAAKSWERAGQNLRAANLLEQYLNEAPPDAPDRERATAVLAEVSKRVGRLELHRSGAVDVKLDDVATDRAFVYVAAGEHVVSATASDGSVIQRRATVDAGGVASVSLAPEPRPAPILAPVETREEPVAKPRSGLSPWFVVVGGVATAAAGAAAIGFGMNTVHDRDAYRANPTSDGLAAAYQSQTRTNIAIGTAAGLAAVTTVVAVFFVQWKSEGAR